jgi:hypothetical protein
MKSRVIGKYYCSSGLASIQAQATGPFAHGLAAHTESRGGMAPVAATGGAGKIQRAGGLGPVGEAAWSIIMARRTHLWAAGRSGHTSEASPWRRRPTEGARRR